MSENIGAVGYACAYTPLVLIDAFGFPPLRLTPVGGWPDQAGGLLHDNLCPHVKRLLDRALAGDLPPLDGLVIMASCDAMRRLADAWRKARPGDRIILIDLPVASDERSVAFFAEELSRLRGTLAAWRGRDIATDDLRASAARYNRISRLLADLRQRVLDGTLAGGAARRQAILRQIMTHPFPAGLKILENALSEPAACAPADGRVPVFLFGNVMWDAESFELFEACGARIVTDDLCTGSRAFHPLDIEDADADDLRPLARALLSRPPCARTMDSARPARFAEDVIAAARACGARGVIGHVLKFCDPYLARIPGLREAAREAGLPLLVLEGDCTMRSVGQHRTRIEAFIEMIG